MENISNFLLKIKKLINQDEDFKSSISEIVRKNCQVELLSEEIQYQNGVIRLKLTAVKRQQLMIHQERIIEEVNHQHLLVLKRNIKTYFSFTAIIDWIKHQYS